MSASYLLLEFAFERSGAPAYLASRRRANAFITTK